MNKQIFKITTSAGGSASVDGPSSVLGELYAIEYQPGTIDTGATVTVTCKNGVTTKPLLTKASAGTSPAIFYPRDLVSAVADGAALTGTAGGDRCKPVLAGTINVAVASGGNGGIGVVIVYFED
jgi:hypothetical protein